MKVQCKISIRCISQAAMFQYSSSHGSAKGACPVVCDLHTYIVSTLIEMHTGSAPHPCCGCHIHSVVYGYKCAGVP